jgi:hypothetical protein
MKSGYKKKKWTYELLNEYVKNNGNGDELLSKEYFGWTEKHEFLCARCGEHYFLFAKSFVVSGNRCIHCRNRKLGDSRRLTFDYVKSFVDENGEGDVLVSEKYTNSTEKLEIKCHVCGENYKISFTNYQVGKRHKKCAMERAGKERRLKESKIKSVVESFDCELIDLEHRDNDWFLKIRFVCGHIDIRDYSSFKMSKKLCRNCTKEMAGKQRRNDEEHVRNFILSKGCEWIDGIYENQESELKIRFSCGHIGYRNFAKFKCSLSVCTRCSGKQKYTLEETKQIFKDAGYDLLANEYINCKTNMTFTDKDGYKYFLSLDKFQHNCLGRGQDPNRFDVGNKYTIENIINYLKLNLSNFYLEEGQIWKRNSERLTFYDDDGYYYYLTFDNLLADIKAGGYPNKIDIGNKYSTINMKTWIKQNSKPFHLVEGQEYKNNNAKLKFKCHKCHPDEIPFIACWRDIQRGMGCGLCVGAQIGNFNNLSYLYPEISRQWDYEKNYPKTPEQTAPMSAKKYYWICPDCKKSYFSSVCKRTGSGRECPNCNESVAERKIRRYLESIGLSGGNDGYLFQHRFDDCKDELPLPFDFYLPKFNVAIEADGLQHFSPVEHFGGESAFINRKRKDEIKTNYCVMKNIDLLRIPYLDFHRIPEILSVKLNID